MACGAESVCLICAPFRIGISNAIEADCAAGKRLSGGFPEVLGAALDGELWSSWRSPLSPNVTFGVLRQMLDAYIRLGLVSRSTAGSWEPALDMGLSGGHGNGQGSPKRVPARPIELS